MKRVLFLSNNENAKGLYEWLAGQGEFVYWCSDKITLQHMEELSPDIVLSYNYKYMISKDVIDFVNGEVFNMHISYLPWNRGANPNFWSFIDETPKGVSIHKVDETLDTGEIVAQKRLHFEEEQESFSTTYQTLQNEIVNLFQEYWRDIKSGNYTCRQQENTGSYHSVKDFKRFVEDNPLSWDDNIAEYKKRLR